jgi:capsular polysaccharide biosynthesis protein
MAAGSSVEEAEVRDRLVDALMEVSRAQLMLSGTLEWAPPSVRPVAEDALASLDHAVAQLRSVAVALGR